MNIVTKRSLSRRIVLRGLGATLGLPLLDAMVPAFSAQAKTAAKPVHRFHAIHVPNGMAMEHWTPSTEGGSFELTPILQPLAPFRNQLLVLSGLDSSWTHAHAGAAGAFLTGTPRGGNSEAEVLADTSIDQLMAMEFGKSTQLASLEVAMEKGANAGQCTAGLNCAYTQTISWRTPTMPLPMENNPRAVFERLFGDSGSADPAVRRARMREKKSLLDSVTERLTDLKRELAPGDQIKVDDYAAAVRDVERRIQLAEAQDDVEPLVSQPQGPPAEYERHLELMFDLQLLALQSDLTRVITFMLGLEQGTRRYPQVGVPEAHHPLSHHGNSPERIALMSKINAYHVKLVTDHFLTRLRETADGDGSLLDHMTILYGTCLSNSNAHSGTDIPILLLGGGAGRLKGGRHLRYSGDTSHANLLVTLMDKLDMPVEKIGASTGKLQIDTLSGV